jgi:hypothetical protein
MKLPHWIYDRRYILAETQKRRATTGTPPPQQVSADTQITYISTTLTTIHYLYRLCSPSILIQKNFRMHCDRKRRKILYNLAATVIQHRLRYLLYQLRLQKQLARLLHERGVPSLLQSAREGRRNMCCGIIQEKWREVLLKRNQMKAVKLISAWFKIKQAKFKRLLAKMGAEKPVLMFQHKDHAAVVSCVMDAILQFQKNKTTEDARKLASDHIANSKFKVLREFTHAEISGKDAVTDGIFRFSSLAGGGSSSDAHHPRSTFALPAKVRRMVVSLGVIPDRRREQRLQRYFASRFGKRRSQKPTDMEKRFFVGECLNLNPRASTNQALMQYKENNVVYLAAVLRTIHRRYPHVRILFDAQVERSAASVTIQATFRSYLSRKQLRPTYLERVCYFRAAILVQRWYRMQTGMLRRMRWHSILNRRVNEINSATLYVEADLFWLLSNKVEVKKMQNIVSLRAMRVGNVFTEQRFCFEKERVYLMDDTDGATSNDTKLPNSIVKETPKKLKKGQEPVAKLRSRKMNARRRRSVAVGMMNSLLIDERTLALQREKFPDWMAFKPDIMEVDSSNPAQVQGLLHDSVAALLLTGAELHLVTMGSVISDPDAVKPDNAAAAAAAAGINSEKAKIEIPEGVMLMSVKFKDVAEARKRAALVLMKTFDVKKEEGVLMCDYSTLSKVINRSSDRTLALPSTWMQELRQLSPGAKLQLEIMCQMHTTEIQPISFLHTKADSRPSSAVLEHRRVEEQKKKRDEAAAAAAAGRGAAKTTSTWLIPGARPNLLVVTESSSSRPTTTSKKQRPRTAGAVRRPTSAAAKSDPSPRKQKVAEQYLVSGTTQGDRKPFVPDADYAAQLVRLQSLITKKQRAAKEKSELEDKVKQVGALKGARERHGEEKKERMFSRLSFMNELRVRQYRAELDERRQATREFKEDEFFERQAVVTVRREVAAKSLNKMKRAKEAEAMNMAMKVMADKMHFNAELANEELRKEKESEELHQQMMEEKKKEEEATAVKKQRPEATFAVKLGMVNRIGGKLGRDMRSKKQAADIKKKVQDRKIVRESDRSKKMDEMAIKHAKDLEKKRREKAKLEEDLIMREIVERENLVKRKLLYGSGVPSVEGGGATSTGGSGVSGLRSDGLTIDSGGCGGGGGDGGEGNDVVGSSMVRPPPFEPVTPHHQRTASEQMMLVHRLDSMDDDAYIWKM